MAQSTKKQTEKQDKVLHMFAVPNLKINALLALVSAFFKFKQQNATFLNALIVYVL